MKKRTFLIGPGVECDIDRLISTRLLVQANSGGGKSFTLRRLLEQTHGAVQQIVIDPEGEFSSLRERFDYVLAARQGGDTLADPRTAKLLAERLLELGVSAIIDIYELNQNERIRFVRLFLEALVDAPKQLWHPVLVVLDEAHVYCPEKEQAESSSAVKALCSRGRKRGFCAVLATQRLSKLAKDAAAECNNKLVGRTSLDVDMARAGDELGFTKADRLVLRELEDGEFFAFGPAMTKAVTRVKVGPVTTRHPEAGSKLAAVVPPPTDKVKALLPKLSDLPAEAEAREKTVADLKHEIATVRRELTEARRAQPLVPKAVEPKRVDVPVLKDGQLRRAEGIVTALTNEVARHESAMQGRLELLRELTQELSTAIATTRVSPPLIQPPTTSARPHPHGRRAEPGVSATRPTSVVSSSNGHGGAAMGKGERIILTAVAQYPDGVTRDQLSILTGYKRSTRDAYVQRVQASGFVGVDRENIRATAAGVEALGDFEPLPTGDELREYWRGRLPAGERVTLDAIVAAYPDPADRDEISTTTGYKRSTRDAYIQRLGARKLVAFERGGVRASEELFS